MPCLYFTLLFYVAVRDGNNVCFQNTNPSGGTVYIHLNPKGFTYMSEVYYEIQKLQTVPSGASSVRDQRPLLNTTPLPVRRFQRFPDDITPVPRIRDFEIQRPAVSPRQIPSRRPLPLSRQWFIRRLPVFINRVREDVRSNVVQPRDNTRLRQGLRRFFRQWSIACSRWNVIIIYNLSLEITVIVIDMN